MLGCTTVRRENLIAQLPPKLAAVGRLLARGAGAHEPLALFGTELPPKGPGPAREIHRFLAEGQLSGWPRASWWAVQLLLAARRSVWRRREAQKWRRQRLQVAYASATGIPVAEQRRLLRKLVARRGIPALEAYRYGLVRRSRLECWDEYVYSCERNWNLAASVVMGRAVGAEAPRGSADTARATIETLSDKVATSQVLNDVGIPVAPTVELLPGTLWNEHAATIDMLLARWSAVFLKPRYGSGGEGAINVAGTAGAWRARCYKDGQLAQNAADSVRSQLDSVTYLAQPLLQSARAFGDLCPDSDVATLRVVTREIGGGPEVFSRVLELPVTELGGDRCYAFVPVGSDGVAFAGVHAQDCPVTLPVPEQRSIVKRVDGLSVPGAEAACEWAIRAHKAVGYLFAIAWDIALTDDGPVFLEGNAGFDMATPQTCFGGLLAGLDADGQASGGSDRPPRSVHSNSHAGADSCVGHAVHRR